MRVPSRVRSERGASAVEYAVIVGAISLGLIMVASALGINVQSGLCTASRALGGAQSCTSNTQGATSSASASPSATPAGGSGGSGGGGAATTPSGSATTASPAGASDSGGGTSGAEIASPQNNGSAGSTGASASPSASTAANSAGNQQFYLATIDQDQIVSDLSVRFNAGWQPSNWNNVTYPTTTVVDVTWSPALAVDQVITGSDGDWSYVLVSPGHLRLVRTGPFDASGFQPEPEILLKKPATTTVVTAGFTVTTGNTPAVSATASTRSTPY